MSLQHDFAYDSVPASAVVFTAATPEAPVTTPEAPVTTPNGLEDAKSSEAESLTPPERSVIWGVPFDRVTLGQAVVHIEKLIDRGQPSYVITANMNYVMLHHRQKNIRPITDAADLILADGQPIVWRSRLGNEPLPERVAGSEMIYHLADMASLNGWGIYFLGGQPGVAATCAERLACLYPGLKIAGVESPPYRPLTLQEQAAQDERIRSSGAHLLLVAFGQPKGECWIHEHYKRLGVPVSIQLGASFDFIAGTATRAPQVWQRLGLEWAYRMFSDPRRLVPRYFANACFLAGAAIEDWKRKVTSWGLGNWTSDASKGATNASRRVSD